MVVGTAVVMTNVSRVETSIGANLYFKIRRGNFEKYNLLSGNPAEQ